MSFLHALEQLAGHAAGVGARAENAGVGTLQSLLGRQPQASPAMQQYQAPRLTAQQLRNVNQPVAPKSQQNPNFTFGSTHLPAVNGHTNWLFQGGRQPEHMPTVQAGIPVKIPLQDGSIGTDYMSRDPGMYVHGQWQGHYTTNAI